MSNFCILFAKKCALLLNFVELLQIFTTFYPLFRRFFLALFTHTTHAANRHLFTDQKQICPREKPKKTAISPHFLNFKKFHLSIMLMCAILCHRYCGYLSASHVGPKFISTFSGTSSLMAPDISFSIHFACFSASCPGSSKTNSS